MAINFQPETFARNVALFATGISVTFSFIMSWKIFRLWRKKKNFRSFELSLATALLGVGITLAPLMDLVFRVPQIPLNEWHSLSYLAGVLVFSAGILGMAFNFKRR